MLLARGPWRSQSNCWPWSQLSKGSTGAGESGSTCTQVAVGRRPHILVMCPSVGLLLKWQLPPGGRGRCDRVIQLEMAVMCNPFQKVTSVALPRFVGCVDQPGTTWESRKRVKNEMGMELSVSEVKAPHRTDLKGPAGRPDGGGRPRAAVSAERAGAKDARVRSGERWVSGISICGGSFNWVLGHGPCW